MHQQQMQAAMNAMTEWLAHPQELGKRPAKIECAGEFDLHDMHYYMFRYKKSMLGGKWLLGVCGGYEEDDLEHCGHVFSEMEEYDPATAREKAAAMVEGIRAYWMQRAAEAEAGQDVEGEQAEEEDDDGENKGGPFVTFVLLNECRWDKEAYKAALEREWGIRAADNTDGDETREKSDSLVWEVDGMMAAVSLMPGPVPNDEAVHNAANNYMWPEAVEVTKGHVAHLLVAALPRENSFLDCGSLLVKLTDACLTAEHAVGVYACGTVFQPAFYREAAGVMKNGALPYLNWIYFGLRRSEEGLTSGYTYGLEAFCKDEIEVLDSKASLQEVRSFLLDISSYVLSSDVILRDGETIGFSAEQKLPITRSAGVYLDGQTLKIAFEPGK